MLTHSLASPWIYILGCQPDYSGLPCIALCLTDHCLQSWSFRSLQRENRSDVDVPSRAWRHSGRLMKDTRAARLAAALPELELRGQTERVQQPPRDGESQESPGGTGARNGRASSCTLPWEKAGRWARKGSGSLDFSLLGGRARSKAPQSQ